MKVYLDAVVIYDEQDVEAAVDAFLSGSAPGVSNYSFAPSAPMVGSEARRQMNLRLEREHREQLTRPKLPPPDIERSPEAQARVKALMERTVNGLTADMPDEDPKERHRRRIARANEYWDADAIDAHEDAA